MDNSLLEEYYPNHKFLYKDYVNDENLMNSYVFLYKDYISHNNSYKFNNNPNINDYTDKIYDSNHIKYTDDKDKFIIDEKQKQEQEQKQE